MCQLHQRLFSDFVADDYADLHRWIEDSGSNTDLDEILLVSKTDGMVVGYIFAQYYKSSEYLFVSYLGIDDENTKARKAGVALLLGSLLRYITKKGYPWKAIVGELEEFRRVNYGREVGYEPHAKKLMLVFQHCIRRLSSTYDLDTDVFRIFFDYLQPALRPEEIESRSKLDPRDLRQWVLFIPHERNVIRSANEQLYISKKEVLEILHFVLLQTYADAHRNSASFLNHLQSEWQRYKVDLPDRVEVTRSWRRV
jgi:hypothetical protein